MIDSFGFFLGEVHKKKLTGFEKALKLGVQENPVVEQYGEQGDDLRSA